MASDEKRFADKTLFPKGTKCPCCIDHLNFNKHAKRLVYRAARRKAKKQALREQDQEIFS